MSRIILLPNGEPRPDSSLVIPTGGIPEITAFEGPQQVAEYAAEFFLDQFPQPDEEFMIRFESPPIDTDRVYTLEEARRYMPREMFNDLNASVNEAIRQSDAIETGNRTIVFEYDNEQDGYIPLMQYKTLRGWLRFFLAIWQALKNCCNPKGQVQELEENY